MKHGLILVDTKYEFGKASDGSILLIDEVNYSMFLIDPLSFSPLLLHHGSQKKITYLNCSIFIKIHTPDSSRYWIGHSYQERFWNGIEPENVDKVLKLLCEIVYSLCQFQLC